MTNDQGIFYFDHRHRDIREMTRFRTYLELLAYQGGKVARRQGRPKLAPYHSASLRGAWNMGWQEEDKA